MTIKYFKDNLKILNSPEYIDHVKEFESPALKEVLSKKARYLKGQTALLKTLSLDELRETTNDDDVTLTGLFLFEVLIVTSEHPKLISLWENYKPEDPEKIVQEAFANFDTLRNSETYHMDDICYQALVSECVRKYFEEIYDHALL